MNDNELSVDELAQVQTIVTPTLEPQGTPLREVPAAPNLPTKAVASRPDYWPEDLWDSTSGAPKLQEASKRLQEEQKRVEGFRKTIADREAAMKPQIPEKYSFEQGEEFNQLPEDDREVLGIFSEISKQVGLSNEQAERLLSNYQDKMSARQQSYNEKKQAALGEHGKQLVEKLDLWAQTRQNRGTFSNAEADAFKNLVRQDVNLATAMAKTISQTGEKLIPTNVQAQVAQQTKADIKLAMQDVLTNKTMKEYQKKAEMDKLRSKLMETL